MSCRKQEAGSHARYGMQGDIAGCVQQGWMYSRSTLHPTCGGPSCSPDFSFLPASQTSLQPWLLRAGATSYSGTSHGSIPPQTESYTVHHSSASLVPGTQKPDDTGAMHQCQVPKSLLLQILAHQGWVPRPSDPTTQCHKT